jgi:PAS domain S-box-containing protein
MIGTKKMALLNIYDSEITCVNELETLKTLYKQELKARLKAELLLEQKTVELFHTNQELNLLNESLVSKIKDLSLALNNSDEKYRGIIEKMEFGLLEVDAEGIIVKAYPRFCEMVAYEAAELIGKEAALIFLPKTFAPVLKQQYIDKQQGKGGVYEVQMVKKDGERIWFLFSGTAILDANGLIIGSLGIHYDITYSKKLQIALDEARRRAEAAQDAEKQFLANMSHEIRTPLNAVIGMSHLLYDTQPTEEQNELLGILKNSAEILRVLISDILDLSKIRSGNIEVQKVEIDVVGIVRTLVKSTQLRLEDRPLSIEADIDPKLHNMVIGDDLLLNQILANLIGNAEKFTAEGSIKVTVKIKKRQNNRILLEFSVADTGIGIPKNKHEAIFQTFQQVDGDIKRKFGGTGLGLAITKQLIELQGGAISLKSRLGKGATFTFTIPYQDTVKTAISEIHQPLESMQLDTVGKTILVVEDNYMNRKYISTLFQKWGIEHEIAHHGKEALAKTRQKQYDLILMDVQMPEMDGYEATIAIRNSQQNPNRDTPIMALTASALVSQKDRAFQVGMNDYLSKPFKPAQLFEKLQSFGQRMATTHPHTDLSQDNQEGACNTCQEDDETAFSYNPRLDKNLLKDLYGDDLAYAREMFDTFINKSLPEVTVLKRQLSTENWTELGRLAHKLKPSFGMVGLPDIEEKMQHIEDMAKGYPSYMGLYSLLNELEKALTPAVEAVKSDLKKLYEV